MKLKRKQVGIPGNKNSGMDLKKYVKQMEELNERIREKMNEIQEKDQRLLDATEQLEHTNEELRASKDELESTLNQLEAQQEHVLAERDRLDTIIRQMGEGLLVINEQREIELINDRAKEILGYTAMKNIPLGYKKFFVLQLWKELSGARGEIVKKEISLQRPREAVLLVTLARLAAAENEQAGFVAVLRDVTFEKRVEKMKSDFVANVSHEIRSRWGPRKVARGWVLIGPPGP